MAENALKIDDNYCKTVAKYYKKQGDDSNKYIKKYISILQGIRKDSIKNGEVAKALDAYIVYAKKLDNEIVNIASNAQQQANNFIKAVDKADKYTF